MATVRNRERKMRVLLFRSNSLKSATFVRSLRNTSLPSSVVAHLHSAFNPHQGACYCSSSIFCSAFDPHHSWSPSCLVLSPPKKRTKQTVCEPPTHSVLQPNECCARVLRDGRPTTTIKFTIKIRSQIRSGRSGPVGRPSGANPPAVTGHRSPPRLPPAIGDNKIENK